MSSAKPHKDAYTESEFHKVVAQYLGDDNPISGGLGFDTKHPIIINESDPAKAAFWEDVVIKIIAKMQKDEYTLLGTAIISENDRMLARHRVTWSQSKDNVVDYYFDVNAAFAED